MAPATEHARVLRVVLRLTARRSNTGICTAHREAQRNRNWTQIIPDRPHGFAAATSNVGYRDRREADADRCRGANIRTILMTQRIASHCLWVGTHAMDTAR
jgi:NADH:ubiquinone oxidoreductase subunit D